MIKITKSLILNSRPIDQMKLLEATTKHMDSVLDGTIYFADKMVENAQKHDYTKIEKFPDFHSALESDKIKESDWYKYHVTEERHHLMANVADDVNLLDVMEYICDCVMAGSARSDTIYDITLPDYLLQKAFANTVEMLKKEIVIKED